MPGQLPAYVGPRAWGSGSQWSAMCPEDCRFIRAEPAIQTGIFVSGENSQGLAIRLYCQLTDEQYAPERSMQRQHEVEVTDMLADKRIESAKAPAASGRCSAARAAFL